MSAYICLSLQHHHITSGVSLTCYPSNGHPLVLGRRDGHDDMVTVAALLLVVRVVAMWVVRMPTLAQLVWVVRVVGGTEGVLLVPGAFATMPISLVLVSQGVDRPSTMSVFATGAGTAWTEQQRVHDGAGHQLNHPR